MRILPRKKMSVKEVKVEKDLIEKLRTLKDNEILEIEYPSKYPGKSEPRMEIVFKGRRGFWRHGISLTWNCSARMVAKYILGHYEDDDMHGGTYCPDGPTHITKNRIPAKYWRRGEE